MDSEQGGYISKETGTGTSTCRVKGRRKCPRLLEVRDYCDFDVRISNPDAGSYLCMTP